MLVPMILHRLRRLRLRPVQADPLEMVRAEPPARRRLVVGLGNPGQAYAETRHNVGFRCADVVATRLGGVWLDQRQQLHSLVAAGRVGDTPIVVAKPQTYVNRSGLAVSALLDRLDLTPAQVLVIYDDMDLPLGTLRLRERGSPGTHNGMRNIVAQLATEDFPRLRIGIGQAGGRDAREYVLSAFDEMQRLLAAASVARAADAALAWATQGPVAAMNAFNG